MAIVILAGCNSSKKKEIEPIWKNVKLGDLVPPDVNRPADEQLKTINFNVFIYEVPASKIGDLNDIWQILSTKPLQFSNYDAFRANSFMAGFGQGEAWGKIGEALQKAGGKESELFSLLLVNGQADGISIVGLQGEQTIWYFPRGDAIEGATVGHGELTLRVRAQETAEQRGVCKVEMQPAFASLTFDPIREKAGKKSRDFLFSCCRLRLKMGVGDFIFLGPDKYISDKVTLGSLFFSRPSKRLPTIMTYLIVCSSIND